MISFKVANVAAADIQLETFPMGERFESLLGVKPESHSHKDSQIVAVQEETWTKQRGNFVKPATYNNFIQAIHLAFNDHRPLSLSPDHIWMMISQGLALHINKNAEELRHHFVNFEGKKYLEIQRDSFVKGRFDNDWQGCFPEFSDKIAEFIGKKRDLIVANFSTTGVIEKAISEIVLMDSMQSYFDYGCRTCCGIPEITLEGIVEDYKNIKQRVQAFDEFGLKWWTDKLIPTIDQFIAAFNGKTDPKFWESIYKLGGGSGGPYITGWVNTLMPYLVSYDGKPFINSMVKNETKWQQHGPTHDALPSGLSKVPFKWFYYEQEFEMEFIGGFTGVSQNGLTLRPELGWAVKEGWEESKSPDKCMKSVKKMKNK